MTGIDVLVDKFVIAGWHVHYTRLDDKHIDTHNELGEHGDEHAVDLVRRH